MSTVAVLIKDVDQQYGDLRTRIELLRESSGVRFYPAGYKHPTRMNGCGRSSRCHASFDKTERR
jgi:hypothetical protein